jgi:tetratricopeptide (TPR) repeat protein
MSDVLAGTLGLLLATNKGAALTNLVAERTGLVAPVTATNDQVETEFRAILKLDDEASDAVDKWLEPYADGSPVPPELDERIRARQGAVELRYRDFLTHHPRHARARTAFGDFLGDVGDETGMAEEWEKAREIDPDDPAAWNNLAGHYAHRGPIGKAFPYLEKAIELNPREAQYWHSLGTITYLFRRDAETHFKTDEPGVFRKAFEFYGRATALRPFDFKLAADVAQTWYGVKPPATATPEARKSAEAEIRQSGMAAWTNAYRIAPDDEAREGIRLHFARWQIRAGELGLARTNLDLVTNAVHRELKARLERNLGQALKKP